jgi:DNA-binding NtrC family response regulator
VNTKRMLIVDDDTLFCDAMRDALAGEAVEVTLAHTVASARIAMEGGFAVVLLDNQLAEGDGLSLVPELNRVNPRVKVILCTGFPALHNAVAALRLGLFDYHVKPIDVGGIVAGVRRALGTLAVEERETADEQRCVAAPARHLVIGGSAETCALRDTIRRAARVRAPVLITGETGTGKTLVARAIHAEGSPSRPFVHVNCAALPEGLVESELFGAERGAFTGAGQAREGLFEQADGGTLFLDEVGELPASIQAKLLTALEEGWIRRVGGARPRHTDARIIAATNADVESAVERGSLRADLFYRLNVVRLDLSPLRAHPEELADLARHLLSQLPGGGEASLPPDEIARLCAHPWPGNTRELRNVLERALVLQGPGALRPSALLACRHACGVSPRAGSLGAAPAPAAPARAAVELTIAPLAEIERRHVLAAVDSSQGNRAQAARALGISVATLRRKLTEYGAADDHFDPPAGSN